MRQSGQCVSVRARESVLTTQWRRLIIARSHCRWRHACCALAALTAAAAIALPLAHSSPCGGAARPAAAESSSRVRRARDKNETAAADDKRKRFSCSLCSVALLGRHSLQQRLANSNFRCHCRRGHQPNQAAHLPTNRYCTLVRRARFRLPPCARILDSTRAAQSVPRNGVAIDLHARADSKTMN